MALRNSVKPFMKVFWEGFFSIATWSNLPKSGAAERFKELLKPIECGSFEDGLRNLQGDFTRVLPKVLSDDRF